MYDIYSSNDSAIVFSIWSGEYSSVDGRLSND